MERFEPYRCAVCDKEGAVFCVTCEDAAFCPDGCKAEGEQRIHQLLCEELDRWGWSTPRPVEDSYIAIYFPVEGSGPTLYWSKGRFKVQTSDATGLVEEIDLLSVHGDQATSGDIEISRHPVTKKKLLVPVILSVRDQRGLDGSPINLSILEMTRGDQRGFWAGPAVLYCQREHVTLADLTYVCTFLKTYRDQAGSLKHALRVGELGHVESDRPELFSAVSETTRIRREARNAARNFESSAESERGNLDGD